MRRLALEPGFGGLDEGDMPTHHVTLEAGLVYAFGKDVTVWSGSRRELEDWRGRLAALVAGLGRKQPFRRLMELEHDEDVIGSWTAAKLTRDLHEWDNRARECGDGFYRMLTLRSRKEAASRTTYAATHPVIVRRPVPGPKALRCTTIAAATSRSRTAPHSQRCSRSETALALIVRKRRIRLNDQVDVIRHDVEGVDRHLGFHRHLPNDLIQAGVEWRHKHGPAVLWASDQAHSPVASRRRSLAEVIMDGAPAPVRDRQG